MNTWLLRFGSILIAAALLTGCSSDDKTDQETTENQASEAETATGADQENEEEEIAHFTLSIDEGDEVITEKEVSIAEGDLLMDVLKANFDVEEEGGFITSIEGVSPDEGERSEEHTSELQSRGHLVCRLLLEKKKKKK